ncbi:ankyrin repeat protein [Medicago truncatula]|uniref:Ankyrin repeat protein n=1 Tax=Medicago truncatula TaxID=3880 RepID=A0A072U7J9_MEDTR|nr:ankyrin repeat protein [Medicago truncatula]
MIDSIQMVESIVPPMCQEAKNADGLKPRELFKKNHEQLVNEGRQWAKDIASSFTIMGTLIITIMFAAAFTVPGGNNQDKGTPIFLGRNAFSFFIISDALSLTASSSSVLMFIGVLISRYTEEDFVTSLPIKLLFGLFTIFLSVVFMMCAFCAALALMLKGYRWIIKAAIVSSIIPILVFMFTLLRLFLESNSTNNIAFPTNCVSKALYNNKYDEKLTHKYGNTSICSGNKISQTCKNL